MTVNQRWTIWLSLLGFTLIAVVWLGLEPDDDVAVSERKRAEALAVSPGPSDTRNARQSSAVSLNVMVAASRVSDEAKVPIADPFSPKSWYSPPPSPPSEPPSRPTAPPLPFRYLGTLEGGNDQWLVQLARGEEGIIAGQGEVIGDLYRLEGLEQGDLIFTYLPLGTRQSLPAILDSDR